MSNPFAGIIEESLKTTRPMDQEGGGVNFRYINLCRRHAVRILLVEDEVGIAHRSVLLLEQTGLQFDREIGVDSALAQLGQRPCEVVLLFSRASHERLGSDVARLKEAVPEGAILVVGPQSSDTLLQEIMRAGADDYLGWPDLSPQLLLRALALLLQRRVLSGEARAWKGRAAELAAEKLAFTSTVSHEILNPLAGVLGFAKLLSGTPLDDFQREFVDVICDCTLSLSALVKDLLALSQIEAGHNRAAEEPFSLSELLDDLALFFGQALPEESAVRFLVVGDPNLPLQVNGDRGKLRQLIGNLLHNSLKFTSAGHVILRLCVLEREPESVKVRITVEDSGRGIPPDKCEEIFRPFVQAMPGDRHGGHGLGLSICARLAHLMRARLRVRSQLGRGTTAEVELELACTSGEVAVEPFLKGRRVLAVSSYEPEREAFAEMFRRLGAEVVTGEDTAQKQEYDLTVQGEETPAPGGCRKGPRIVRLCRPDGKDPGASLTLTAPLRLTQLVKTLSPAGAPELLPGKKTGREMDRRQASRTS